MTQIVARSIAADDSSFLPPSYPSAPHDVHVARAAFGANCGPAALAAILSLGVCDVMQLFPQFPERPTTAPRQMRRALEVCGLHVKNIEEFPKFGLALVAAEGPWSRWKRATGWTLRYTHWVAVRGQEVYDINEAGWSSMESWSVSAASNFQGEWPKMSGWCVRLGLEILPQDFRKFERLNGLVRDCIIRR